MKAVGKFLVVKSLDNDDVKKTDGGIFIANQERPNLGRYEIISIGEDADIEVSVGDKVWALSATVSKSSNIDKALGIIKYENIMAKDS